MKKIETFRGYGKIYEMYGKRHGDTGGLGEIRYVVDKIDELLKDSPILFDAEYFEKYVSFVGPFGLGLTIKQGDGPVISAEITMDGPKEVVYGDDAEELWEELRKNSYFKAFVKGDKPSKLADKKKRDVVKRGKNASWSEMVDLLVEYIKFETPQLIELKKDTSGPYTTTGTSVESRLYDVTPLLSWFPSTNPNFQTAELKDIYKNHLAKGDGWYQGPLTPESISELDSNARADYEEVDDGIYDVYVFTPYMGIESLVDSARKALRDRMPNSGYLVDVKVEGPKLKFDFSKKHATIEFVVSTTVWYN
jgi:hypothetical protein